jgi:RHS repeat-associated protein
MTYGPDFTNLASIKTRTISFNADNMPTQIIHSSGVTTNILYDGMGTRVKKSVGATNTYYIGDHFEIEGGTSIKYIFAGSLRVAQVKGSTRTYFHKDHLGSSTVMTNASGLEIESTDYMPFGGIRNHTGTNTSNYKFTDQEMDAENGLYNYNARMYDPFIGRFISADPIVPEPYNPQSLNRYSYCLNNPLIYVDPSGYTEEDEDDLDEYTLPVITVYADSYVDYEYWINWAQQYEYNNEWGYRYLEWMWGMTHGKRAHVGGSGGSPTGDSNDPKRTEDKGSPVGEKNGIIDWLKLWRERARESREATNKFFEDKYGKYSRRLLPPIGGAVANTFGTVTITQAAKSLTVTGPAGIRGIATLGAGGTVGSAIASTAIAVGTSWLAFESGLYIGSYIEVIYTDVLRNNDLSQY